MTLRKSLLLLTLAGLAALAAGPADVSGSWKCKVNSPEGEHPATLTVTQDGEKITGSFVSHRGQYKVEGTVKGDRIEFTVRYTGGDAPPAIPFEGKLEGHRMTGQYRAGETTGSWTAEKEK